MRKQAGAALLAQQLRGCYIDCSALEGLESDLLPTEPIWVEKSQPL